MNKLNANLKRRAEAVNNPRYEKPSFFDLKKKADEKKLNALIGKKRVSRVIDSYADQIKELVAVWRPRLLRNPEAFKKAVAAQSITPREGVWAYFPWSGALVHVLKPSEYRRLRSSRNFNLILPAEHREYASARIGVAGLNVGNPGAICIALEGGAERLMKLADNDILSLSNMNRFNAGVSDLGTNKAVLSARQIHEINPFAKLAVFPNGITPGNIEQFLLRPRIDLLIEEMDNLPLKIAIREPARKHRIPVIMVTGNGSGLILDVERFDLTPDLPLLNRHLPERVVAMVKGGGLAKLGFQEKVLLARDFMGKQYLTKRLRDSFMEVGKSLASIPQLAEASYLRGAVLAYAARRIVAGAGMPSGRYVIQIGESLRRI